MRRPGSHSRGGFAVVGRKRRLDPDGHRGRGDRPASVVRGENPEGKHTRPTTISEPVGSRPARARFGRETPGGSLNVNRHRSRLEREPIEIEVKAELPRSIWRHRSRPRLVKPTSPRRWSPAATAGATRCCRSMTRGRSSPRLQRRLPSSTLSLGASNQKARQKKPKAGNQRATGRRYVRPGERRRTRLTVRRHSRDAALVIAVAAVSCS